MNHDRECFAILRYFLPFYSPNNPKKQNEKKREKCLEISSFYNSVPKIMIICHTVTEIWCITDVIIIFHFGLCFASPSPQQPQKWEFQTNEKNAWRNHHFTQVYQKSWSYATLILRHGV